MVRHHPNLRNPQHWRGRWQHHIRGNGNWFARYGQIHAWLIRQDAITADDAVEENREGMEEE